MSLITISALFHAQNSSKKKVLVTGEYSTLYVVSAELYRKYNSWLMT